MIETSETDPEPYRFEWSGRHCSVGSRNRGDSRGRSPDSAAADLYIEFHDCSLGNARGGDKIETEHGSTVRRSFFSPLSGPPHEFARALALDGKLDVEFHFTG